VSGHLRLVPCDDDQPPRLMEFRAAHPEVAIDPIRSGVWQGVIPTADGEIVRTRYSLRELLDVLSGLLGDR
jgi:hypothetical protein